MGRTQKEAVGEVQFVLHLQPKQDLLFKQYELGPHKHYGYGGSRGGAKSNLMRQLILWRRLRYPKTVGFIIRKTYDDLLDNHIRPMLYLEYPWLKRYYNVQEKLLRLPGNSWLRFISSDNYEDIFSLYGKEAADVMVDQAEQFTEEQLEFLHTVNRCTTNIEIRPKTLWCFNPGGVGHQYLKRVFIDRDYKSHEDPNEFYFVRAHGWDNIEWVRPALQETGMTPDEYYSMPKQERRTFFIMNSDYGRTLQNQPEEKRRAQLDGDFDVYAGQFFYNFRREIHVIDPPNLNDESLAVSFMNWNKFGGLDWGDTTVLEVCYVDYEGNVVFYCENTTKEMPPADRINAMADLLMQKGLFRLPIFHDTDMLISYQNYALASDKNTQTLANEIFRQRMKDLAPILIPVSKGRAEHRGFRANINDMFRQGLDWKKDKEGHLTLRPKIYMTRDCGGLIQEIPLFVTDPNSNEQMDFEHRKQPDHHFDAAKFCYVGTRLPIQQQPPKEYRSMDEWMKINVFDKIIDRSGSRNNPGDRL